MDLKDHFEEGWWQKLSPFFDNGGFKPIATTLAAQKKAGDIITPKFDDVFRAFKECPYSKLKVVMMGQDPYYQVYKNKTSTHHVADGLAFSARYDLLDPPASFQLISSAIEREVYGGFGIGYNEEYMNPDLTRWANQGVLLINCALTTKAGLTQQHMDIWAPFMRYLFNMLRNDNSGLIYIFLGKDAKQWQVLVNRNRNHAFHVIHPAAVKHTGRNVWDSEGVFLKTNELLEQANGPEAKILW